MSLLLASGGSIESHLKDSYIWGRFFSAHHVLMAAVGGIMVYGFWKLAQRTKGAESAPKGLGGLVEVTLVWVRDEIVYPWLGPERGRQYLYFFWTLFFFILLSNLIGLLPVPLNPWGKTATGNISVTAALALITFVMVQVSGMKQHGWGKYWLHIVPGGIPTALWPLMWLVEFIGLFTKPFALTVRLFANMTGGHAIMAVLGGFFLGVAHYANPIIGGAVSVATLGFALFIMLFETLVALIQAYIFTVLSAIFVSLAVAEEH